MNAFGRYEIVRRIGVGGMGEVYFAWAYGAARTRKPVVVKVLRGEMLSEPGALEMFVEEGRLSLNLSHSNVLQVFDFGKADDRYFMAMEYVDGFHLGELKRRAGGTLEVDLACFIAMEVCLGLDYAHRLRSDEGKPLHIVHRDVTPTNVLISREGEVKLADFGIARATGRSQHTQAGQIRGKVRYMSPEAARGEPLDGRSDLFSLGAILFELLTGRRVFDAKGGREAVLQQIVSGQVPPPSSVADEVPKSLDAVVLKSMAFKREDRYPDAFAMHRAIEEGCRAAGLHPSRGRFLEFLRELDAADAAAEANSWASNGSAIRPDAIPGVTPADARQGALTITPARQRSTPATPSTAAPFTPVPIVSAPVSMATGAVGAPPVWPVGEVPAGPTAAGGPGVPLAPAVPASRISKPSSTAGAVPQPVAGPETVLPTGVAAPVLFTLTIADPERPLDRPSLEGTPLVPALAHFEVTTFEVDDSSDDAIRAVEPDSGDQEPTVLEPRRADRGDDFAADPASGEQSRWRVRPRNTPMGPSTRARVDDADFPAIPARRSVPVIGGRGILAGAIALVLLAAVAIAVVRQRGAGPAVAGSGIPEATPFAARSPASSRTPKATPVVAAVTPGPAAAATRAPTPMPTHTAIAVRTSPPGGTGSLARTPKPTPAPTSVAAAAFGLVDVNSDPWSEVRIGGRLLGNTPLVKLRLPVGRHTLSFRNPRSGVVKNVEVDVRSGENGPVLVQLSP